MLFRSVSQSRYWKSGFEEEEGYFMIGYGTALLDCGFSLKQIQDAMYRKLKQWDREKKADEKSVTG